MGPREDKKIKISKSVIKYIYSFWKLLIFFLLKKFLISIPKKVFISTNFDKQFLFPRIVKKITIKENINNGILLIPKNIDNKDKNPSNNCEKGKDANKLA